MKSSWNAWIVCLVAWPLAGATIIDVTTRTAVTLAPGDTLSFLISDSSYVRYAAQYGAPAAPTSISFLLLSSPLSTDSAISAVLQSQDGSVGMSFPTLISATPGWFQSVGYQGPMSSFSGQLSLPETLSSQIFVGSSAVLTLENLGTGDLTVGLFSYPMWQNLYMSLGSGHFSASSQDSAVSWDPPDAPHSEAPEPQSALLLTSGGALCVLAASLKRYWRRVSE
jgi:hypothetical protein